MAIYIKEIYLPEDPNEIIEFAVKGNGNVFVIGEHFALEACNVQEPHGRMIDADALTKKIKRDGIASDPFVKIVCDYFKDAPTVIPSSEEE